MKRIKSSTLKSRAKFKKAVLERDDYKCLYCGMPGSSFSLDADHICGRKSVIDDVREAGATICRYPCHRLKTDGKIKWKENQLPKECIDFIIKRKWEGWDGIEWSLIGERLKIG